MVVVTELDSADDDDSDAAVVVPAPREEALAPPPTPPVTVADVAVEEAALTALTEGETRGLAAEGTT